MSRICKSTLIRNNMPDLVCEALSTDLDVQEHRRVLHRNKNTDGGALHGPINWYNTPLYCSARYGEGIYVWECQLKHAHEGPHTGTICQPGYAKDIKRVWTVYG